VACGAEAIGINFFPGSPRFVTENAAREIVAAVSDRAEIVGVFVNEAPETIVALCGRVGIRRVQLHGDEPPEDASRIPLWRMKAVHADRSTDLPALIAYPCDAFPLRRRREGRLRRDGRELAWGELGKRFPGVAGSGARKARESPWLLAGGLTRKRRARHPRARPVRSRCRLRRGIVPDGERPGQGENVHRTREKRGSALRSVRGA